MSPQHPDDVLRDLLAASENPRYTRNLRILHEVCREAHKANPPDFSQATIGRATASRGGPSLNTLYSPKGKHFRELIGAWVKWAGLERSRPLKMVDRSSEDGEVISRIADPAIKSYLGLVLAERRRLRAEINTLKQLSRGSPIIDMRLPSAFASSPRQRIDLTTDERETLENLVDSGWLAASSLQEGERGELLGKDGVRILGRGALPGIRKLLAAYEASPDPKAQV